MMRQLLSVLPLIFFTLLVLFAGYSILFGQNLASIAQTPTGAATRQPTPTASSTPTTAPTATITASPTAVPISTNTPTLIPTMTETPALDVSATLTPTPTFTPTATPKPSTFVWVKTDSSLGDIPHTLNLISPNAENPVLQQYAVAPALSPDASKLAFYSESSLSGFNTGIWIADIGGGFTENHALLADITDVQNITWSPDGDKIAFEFVLNPSNPPEEWRSEIRIIRVDAADGYVELDRFDGRQPAWSPDGQGLVFYACRGSQCGLFVVNCTGGNCDEAGGEQVTFDSTDGYPVWSSDGNQIAFSTTRDGNHEIYLLSLADNRLQNLTNRATIDTTPLFSPDGQTLYFRTDLDGIWQIQEINLANREINTFLPEVGGDIRSWGLIRPAIR